MRVFGSVHINGPEGVRNTVAVVMIIIIIIIIAVTVAAIIIITTTTTVQRGGACYRTQDAFEGRVRAAVGEESYHGMMMRR